MTPQVTAPQEAFPQGYSPVIEAQQIIQQQPLPEAAPVQPQPTAEKPVGFDPRLLALFMRAHGNEKMTKMVSALLVGDVVTKKIISYNQAAVAHQRQMDQLAGYVPTIGPTEEAPASAWQAAQASRS